MRRVTTAVVSAAFIVPLLTACGSGVERGDGGDASSGPATSRATASPEPTTEATSTEATSTDATEAVTPDTSSTDSPAGDHTDEPAAFPANTARQTADNSGDWDLVLRDVRVGEHEGFDRIVLEFSGTGTPGWTVNYVDEAVLDGSGDAVPLGGDAILDIYASGTTWPASGYYSGPGQFEPEDGGDVADVHVGGTFEGYTQVLAGIEGDRVPFRVLALSGPPRLVVDVVDESTG